MTAQIPTKPDEVLVEQGGQTLDPQAAIQVALAAARRAGAARARSDSLEIAAVRECRRAGLSWHTVGVALGVTGETVRRRYGGGAGAPRELRE